MKVKHRSFSGRWSCGLKWPQNVFCTLTAKLSTPTRGAVQMRLGRGKGRGALTCSDCAEVLHLRIAM